ncbi:MAG TPA: GNAT family N-acetyltransferase [Candidatus Paceibacterota bacterium]|nr:GNAT family N-acetyltransferase [Candidatus Paceibacterota bacterium]
MNEISIKTPRLLLRQRGDTDLLSLAEMNLDPKVMEFIGPIISESESRAMIERARGSWQELGYGRFAVEISETSELIGFIGLAQCKFESHFTPAVEIGWRLAQKHWGFGYATEGADAVMSWAFANCEIDEIVSFSSASNLSSRRVMEKLEMHRSDTDDFLHPNLKPGDPLRQCVLYRKRIPH